MHDALAALLFAAATPTPTPTQPDPELVTPGVWGFVITAFVALAVVLLVADMMRRIRRGRVRADIQEELDAEERAAGGSTAERTEPTTRAQDDEPPAER